jgi:hypothetical protein
MVWALLLVAALALWQIVLVDEWLDAIRRSVAGLWGGASGSAGEIAVAGAPPAWGGTSGSHDGGGVGGGEL